MGEIPDWLMQLSSDEEEEQDDFAMAPPPPAEEPEPVDDVYGLMGITEPEDSPDPMVDMADPMAALRTEIGSTEASSGADSFDRVATSSTRASTSGLALGLLPWQRFFLSILLFLDVAIIGLLFLVMLGSISIPVP